MVQLPQEIINLIVTFLGRYPGHHDLPPWERTGPSNLLQYSTISQAWKRAIESIAFRKITLKSTEIDIFDAIFRGDRRPHLTDLTLFVELPQCDAKARGRLERAANRKANDEAFTDAITKLFLVLKSWEDDGLLEGSIHLTLWGLCAPFNIRKRDFDLIRRNTIWSSDRFEYRYMHSLIHHLRLDRLPSIRRVSMVKFGAPSNFRWAYHGRNLAMETVVDMIMKFPNLENWDCILHDNEKFYPAIRVANRHSFASLLSHCTFPFLKIMSINFFHEAPRNQNFEPEDLRGGHSYDPLSTSLRMILSQCPNLTSLTLTGVFDSSLFWPSSEQTASTSEFNCWPNLEFFSVTFDPTTPSGHWYFTSRSGIEPEIILPTEDNGGGSIYVPTDSTLSDPKDRYHIDEIKFVIGIEPDDDFRKYPNPTHIEPLVVAFANLIKNTKFPSLRNAVLTTGLLSSTSSESFRFEIRYHAPYAPQVPGWWEKENPEDSRIPRMYLEGWRWFPDQELLNYLIDAGERQWGTELWVRFWDVEYYEEGD